jgi:uncharacterized protein (TIGR00369 family)
VTGSEHWIVERVRAAAASGSAYIPVHAVFGVRARDAAPGRTAFGQAMGSHLLDAAGMLCPGAFLIAADAALGSAIATMLPPTDSVLSLSLHAEFCTLDPGTAADFTIRAHDVEIRGTSGFARGEIRDDNGRPIARLSTQCGYTPVSRSRWSTDPVPVPVPSEHVPSAAPRSGLAAIAEHRAGARIVEDTDDALTVAARSTPEICNSRGDLQGGVLGLLVEQALTARLVRATPALSCASTAELDLHFVRAVRADHPEVEITARSEHAGRRFGVARAAGRDGAGRLVVSAFGSRFA